jgi:uncharacterized membrane protein YidH (DUF202 family)
LRGSNRNSGPETLMARTDLAWGRTCLSLVAAAAVFLRWLPQHGWFVGTLVTAAAATAGAISATRNIRIRRAITGISQDQMPPGTGSTSTLAASVVILALLGIYTVLFFPPAP